MKKNYYKSTKYVFVKNNLSPVSSCFFTVADFGLPAAATQTNLPQRYFPR